MKEKNIKLSKKMISILVAGGIVLTPINMCLANSKQGTFIEENEEDKDYYEYVAKSGDNLSIISRKICIFFGEEASTKYWPTLAFLNRFPRVLQPGDIIIFPKTFESLNLINETLRKENWTSRYIQKNNIYGSKKKIIVSREIITTLLNDIYGDDVCVDEDFIRRYLDAHDLDGDYDLLDTDEYDPELFLRLTIWIPSLDELEPKTLTKHK